jgi:hypothetical protein
MPKKIYLLIDIDRTLMVDEDSVNDSAHPKEHLTRIDLATSQILTYYAINLREMTKIMQALIKAQQNLSRTIPLEIAFCTTGFLPPEAKQDFEIIYKLEKDVLKDAIFIGKDRIKDRHETKGVIVNTEKEQGVFGDDPEIWLLDDFIPHLHSARRVGFNTIFADGFPSHTQAEIDLFKHNGLIPMADFDRDFISVKNTYLNKLNTIFDLGIDPTELIPNISEVPHRKRLRLAFS